MEYKGDYTTSNTIYHLFNTFDSNDPSSSVTVTGLALADIKIYKNGSVTQRSSTAGFALLDTDGIDFDATTGIHGFSIDLSDNTDAGFYAAGGEYSVVISSITVDAATINFVAYSFSIERTGGALASSKAIKTKTDFLPSVTAGGAGGLFIAGTNAATTVTTSFTTTFTGNLTGSVASVSGAVNSVATAITLPTIPANWISAAGIAASALDGKGDWNVGKTGYSLTQTFPANFSDLIIEITSGKVNTKVADTVTDGAKSATALSNADWTPTRAGYVDELASANIPQDLIDIKGATFNTATDSLEAIRDRGDTSWITGGGGGITDILNIQSLIPASIDLANTATFRLGLMLINSVDDLPSSAEITPGTISIDRKAIGGTTWIAVVTDAACSKSAGLIYYDEVFGSASTYAEGDSIRITLKSQKITVSANDYEISDATGRMFYSSIRQTMRGTDSGATASNLALAQVDLDTLTDDLNDGGRIDLLIDSIISTLGVAGDGLINLGGMSATMKAEVLAEVVKLLTTQITESYAAVGVAPTIGQLLMLVLARATNIEVVGSEIKIYKQDGTTLAATLTMDSSTAPVTKSSRTS